MGYEIVIKEEVFAFATTLGNFIDKIKTDKKKDISYREAIKLNGVYGADSPNHKNFVKEKDRNSNSKMKLAISGVINELTNGFDYSYGAIRWDGIDIKKAKWKEGLKFAEATHDVFGLEDNKNSGKELYTIKKNGKIVDTEWLRRKWDYVNITTVAYSGENIKKKNPYYPYYKDDKINQNKFATTFVKFHPDFENVIPIKTKIDE